MCAGHYEPSTAGGWSTALIREHRSMASRQRHQSARPATNRRRRPTRYNRRPMETATRLAYRPFHQFIRQRDVQRTTSSTHRSESLAPRHPAPVPNTRSAPERASRTRPLTPVELPASGAAVSTSPSACWSDGPRRSFGCQWSPTFSCVCCRALKPNGPSGRLGHAEVPHPPRLDQVLDRSRHFFDHWSRGRSCVRSTSAGVSSAKQCGYGPWPRSSTRIGNRSRSISSTTSSDGSRSA